MYMKAIVKQDFDYKYYTIFLAQESCKEKDVFANIFIFFVI